MRVSVALVKILKSEGVEIIFALSGNQIMALFDACLDEGIRIIHVRHEAAALLRAQAVAARGSVPQLGGKGHLPARVCRGVEPVQCCGSEKLR